MQKIPLIDIRGLTQLELLTGHKDKALKLIAASRRAFGPLAQLLSYPAAHVGDVLSQRWLEKTGNPYRGEIAAMAKKLRVPGVWALNLVYEFGCTSGVYVTEGGPRLLRVLDWPFKGLGENMVVTEQRSRAGDFHNITWPGVSGVYTAMAQGRFAASLNQAPMRRHRGGIYRDWFRNRRLVRKSRGLPPAHLLRKVCEEAVDYASARELLMREPVAIPVIYVLSGLKNDEGCVIERLENGAGLRDMAGFPSVHAANHFVSHINGIGHGWQPRAIDSCGRALAAGNITYIEAADPRMAWFQPPIANIMSRLTCSLNAATGAMSLLGTEGTRPVTELFRLN